MSHQGSYVRLATLKEVDELAELAQESFIDDPVMNYFGDVQKVCHRQEFHRGWFRNLPFIQ